MVDTLTGNVQGQRSVPNQGASGGEELEGLDYFESDRPPAGTFLNGYGQLHVILVQNNVSDDGFYWKHFRADTPGHL
jgi:hypothetical protein